MRDNGNYERSSPPLNTPVGIEGAKTDLLASDQGFEGNAVYLGSRPLPWFWLESQESPGDSMTAVMSSASGGTILS